MTTPEAVVETEGVLFPILGIKQITEDGRQILTKLIEQSQCKASQRDCPTVVGREPLSAVSGACPLSM